MVFTSTDGSFSFRLRCPGFLYNREVAVKTWGSSCYVETLWVWLKPSTWLENKKGSPVLSPFLCWPLLKSAGQGRSSVATRSLISYKGMTSLSLWVLKTLTPPTPPGIPSQSYCCVRVEVFAGPVVTTHIAGLLSSPDLPMAFFVPTRASDM